MKLNKEQAEARKRIIKCNKQFGITGEPSIEEIW